MDAVTLTLRKTLKDLCLQPGISMHEHTSGIVALVTDLCKRCGADSVETDADGNVVATVGNGPLTVLLEAHLDEVGFEVSEVREDGAVSLLACGTVRGENIDGSEVYIVRTGTTGTLSFDPQSENILFLPSLPNAEIVPGDLVSFKRNFTEADGVIRATALDNRIGCAVLLETLHECKAVLPEGVRVVFVFSLEEETSNTSVKATVQKYNPDLFVVVDAAYASPVDFDVHEPEESIPVLGEGCAIQHKGVGFVVDPQRIAALERITSEQGIKIQRESVEGSRGRTNFTAFLAAGTDAGVVLNVPVQSQHRDISTTNPNDAVGAVALLLAIIGRQERIRSLIVAR